MKLTASVMLFASTTLLAVSSFSTSLQKPSAICKVDDKTIYSTTPGAGSLVKQLQDMDTVTIYGHANLFSGMTMVDDDVYVLFKDIDTRIVLKGAGDINLSDMESTQKSAIFNAKNIEMTKHEEIDGGLFTGRYTHTSKDSSALKVTVSVTETMKTDHILGRTAKITLQNGPTATATLDCVDSMGGRFTYAAESEDEIDRSR